MRIFIAIDLDHPDYFSTLQQTLRAIPDARMTFPSSYHLTLQFLGDINQLPCKAVQTALSLILFEPFALSCNHLGTFPEAGPVRVIWAGFAGKPPARHHEEPFTAGYTALCTLQQRIATALAPLGFTPEKQFAPHVTLARIKHLPPPAATALHNIILARTIPPQSFSIRCFGLYKSDLSPSGPAYTLLQQVPPS